MRGGVYIVYLCITEWAGTHLGADRDLKQISPRVKSMCFWQSDKARTSFFFYVKLQERTQWPVIPASLWEAACCVYSDVIDSIYNISLRDQRLFRRNELHKLFLVVFVVCPASGETDTYLCLASYRTPKTTLLIHIHPCSIDKLL